jgi:hexosaminidase
LLSAGCATTRPASTLLPVPRSEIPVSGRFTVTNATPLVAADPDSRHAAERFADLLHRTTGVTLAVGDAPGRRAIVFRKIDGLPPEAYRLDVTRAGATVTASGYSGLYYGGVTLWQLLTGPEPRTARAVRIEDAPRFAWRGLLLDSARHYQSPDFIRHLIDWMSVNKLNRLHWHLTDDQGWRIEIERYPRLTEIGAWRVPASASGAPPLPRTGGFYTQAEIREIVAYARDRAVEIVPEIDLPGHALAAIRAYPELGMGVAPPPGIESDWGVFPWLYNVDGGTFTFLESVLSEVLELFPGTYIHLGGDEAVKDQWRASPAVQARMRALGLADENQLQSWFMGRLARWLEARGRRMIGWDEILQGGLPPGATIMSWQGIDGAVHAAQAGHDAILAASPTLYFDHRQASDAAEPPGRDAVITLADVYAFDPAPATLAPEQQAHILGLQANLWTEHVRTEERAAWMTFPRAVAVAELGWSSPGTRDFAGFVARLVPQLDRLSSLGLESAPSAFRPSAQASLDPVSNRVRVVLSNQVGSQIRYTLDGSAPAPSSPVYYGPGNIYFGPAEVPLPIRLRARGFLDGRALPGELDQRLDATSMRRRDDNQLKLCSQNIPLALEDDAPAQGPRAVFLMDIMNPCWIYEGAPLDSVVAIDLEVGQLPFNFQIGRDIERIHFRPPATAAGEFEVRAGGCDGERIAVLPLAPAASNPAVTRLHAPIAPRRGNADLCITYTARGPDPLWGVDAVQLVTAP